MQMRSKHHTKLKISKHLLIHEESVEENTVEVTGAKRWYKITCGNFQCKIAILLIVLMIVIIIAFTIVPDKVNGV